MTRKHAASTAKLLKEAAREVGRQEYVLRLYIAGLTPRSREALRTVSALCTEELTGRRDLKVIDLYEQPRLAQEEQIVAVPTLVKERPLPSCRFIGAMVDKQRLLAGLDLVPGSR